MVKVMVIDDELELLELVSQLLKKKGYNVCSLSRAEDSFQTISSFSPHILLLDIKLGKLDGRYICRQLKDNPETNKIKIILYSAFHEYSKDYESYGADDFISKPFHFEELIARINIHISVADMIQKQRKPDVA